MSVPVVVAGALVVDGRLLVAQRAHPPALAGRWELPGGKAVPGESDAEALARELAEELGVEVCVAGRVGADVALPTGATLRAYAVHRLDGDVVAREHRALRWVDAAGLDALDWVPADRAWLPDLAQLLAR